MGKTFDNGASMFVNCDTGKGQGSFQWLYSNRNTAVMGKPDLGYKIISTTGYAKWEGQFNGDMWVDPQGASQLPGTLVGLEPMYKHQVPGLQISCYRGAAVPVDSGPFFGTCTQEYLCLWEPDVVFDVEAKGTTITGLSNAPAPAHGYGYPAIVGYLESQGFCEGDRLQPTDVLNTDSTGILARSLCQHLRSPQAAASPSSLYIETNGLKFWSMTMPQTLRIALYQGITKDRVAYVQIEATSAEGPPKNNCAKVAGVANGVASILQVIVGAFNPLGAALLNIGGGALTIGGSFCE
ncbi:hypothetical protein HDU86_000896 [Geranomyces michiganensis]|nr:hypothetical protein HDU86_000896 [Geranomyces michiganensis]